MVQHFLARWKGMFFCDGSIEPTTEPTMLQQILSIFLVEEDDDKCNLSTGHETSPLYPFSPTAAAAPHSLTTGNNLPSRIPTESIFARKTLQYNCWDWEECAWWALVSSLASTAHLIALACVGEQQTITQVLWRSHSALLLQRRQIWRTETRSGFQWLWCGNLPCSWLLGGFKHFSSQRHRSTLHSVNIDQQRETSEILIISSGRGTYWVRGARCREWSWPSHRISDQCTALLCLLLPSTV